MAVVRKFLFDNDFGEAPQSSVGGAQAEGQRTAGAKAERAPIAPPAPPPPMFTEAEMQGACDVARRKGEEAGVDARPQRGGRGVRQAGGRDAEHDRAADRGDRHRRRGRSRRPPASRPTWRWRSCASCIRRWSSAHGLAEIEAVLGQCLESLKQEPRLVAYVHGARLDALQERLTQLSASNGFEGRVVLIGDDAMGESDCRVEWADGGVEREAGRIWRAIEEALTRYIAVEDRDPK